MAVPGSTNAFGLSTLPESYQPPFQVPIAQRPGYPRAGTNLDMGSLILCLVANWFVDGETVLIDGGVSVVFPLDKLAWLNCFQTLLKHPSSY